MSNAGEVKVHAGWGLSFMGGAMLTYKQTERSSAYPEAEIDAVRLFTPAIKLPRSAPVTGAARGIVDVASNVSFAFAFAFLSFADGFAVATTTVAPC